MDSRPNFATTRWSLVLQVDSTDGAKAALEELCKSYWQPIHAFVLQRGFDQVTAEDVTQSFFHHLLEHDTLLRADADRGRFRTFLLTSLKHFLADWKREQSALKRGGHLEFIKFDETDRSELSSTDGNDAVKHYERQWAASIVRRSLAQLEAEFARAGKSHRFALLKDYLLINPPEALYSRLAQELKLTESTLRSSMQRLRLRFRHVFRAEVAETVSSEEEIDAEIRHLLAAL